MLLVLVGNATLSTSLVTEQEGLTWLHARTRIYTYKRENARVHTHMMHREAQAAMKNILYLELKPLKCTMVFYERHDFIARGNIVMLNS